MAEGYLIPKGAIPERCVGVDVLVKDMRGRLAPRDQLIYSVVQQIMLREEPWTAEGPFMQVDMPCGHTAVYDRSSDVPWESAPCTCGNPDHWFIRYREED